MAVESHDGWMVDGGRLHHRMGSFLWSPGRPPARPRTPGRPGWPCSPPAIHH